MTNEVLEHPENLFQVSWNTTKHCNPRANPTMYPAISRWIPERYGIYQDHTSALPGMEKLAGFLCPFSLNAISLHRYLPLQLCYLRTSYTAIRTNEGRLSSGFC
jgi:hypothetical protein